MSSRLPQLAHDDHDLISPELYFLTLPTFQGATREKSYYIVAVNKGFFLYRFHQNFWGDASNYSAEYYICNPLTKQWFALPTYKFFIRINVGFIAQVEDDGNLISFKVILLHCLPTKRKFLEFQVFSSETGKWDEFGVYCESRVRVSNRRRPVVLNNILHWIDCELGIVAYDPYNGPYKLRIIKFPDDAGKGPNMARYGSQTTKCGVFQGRLKYFEIIGSNPTESSTLKIWELQDYSSDHWRLQHSTTGGDIIVPGKLSRVVFRFTTFMSFHPWDPDVVYMCWGGGIGFATYNMHTKRVEPLGRLQSKYDDIDWWRMMSLWDCFLLGPVEIPSSPSIGPDDHVSLLI